MANFYKIHVYKLKLQIKDKRENLNSSEAKNVKCGRSFKVNRMAVDGT